MIDSVYIALTGLKGFQNGLRLISNNSANLNTPGFKSSYLQFAGMYQAPGGLSGGSYGQYGYGLATLGTIMNFQQGQFQNTGNSLDLAVDGQGMFVLRGKDGQTRFTRDGQFMFNADGVLVTTSNGSEVMGYDTNGNLTRITIGSRVNPAKATANVTFSGNLSSTTTAFTIGNVTVIDAAGSSHKLTAQLTAVAGTPGSWTVTLMDGTTTVGTGTIAFINGMPDPANSKVTITYTPPGGTAIPVTLDFSTNVTSYDSGSQSTLAMATQDGYPPGTLTGVTFDAAGVMQLSFSNGQIVKGAKIALGYFNSPDAISAVGDNEFIATDATAWRFGTASNQGFGSIKSGMIEMSNVDLSSEFSNLVIMQRGYQACSQVVSTANEMLSDLFSMKGR
jgi:flagellar hook protein FlgE